jgi:hypothetical protein
MNAVLDSLTTLGFSMELALGVLRATAGITSDFASNLPSFNLFGTEDGFLWSDSYEFLSTDNFATLYEDEFAVEGFNQDSFAGYYDVA